MHSSITNKNINSMRKLFLLFALAVGLLTSASTAMAQTVNMSRYITLTVKSGEAIKLDFKAAAKGTPVRIVSGSNTQDITVGTVWYDGNYPSTYTVTAGASTMTVYGDIISFDCSNNGANLTALAPSHNTQLERLHCSGNQLSSLDVSHNTQLTLLDCHNNQLSSLDISHNTQLTGLYCYGNKFTTATLDDIYCALPDRTSETNGVIRPVHNSSSADHATVLATNAQNAITKNWKVQYYYDYTDIPATTGTYVCGTPHPEPNMSRYITLTVKSGEAIKLNFKAAATNTPGRIVSGSNTQDITVGTSWTGTASYTADGTSMTVYGDLTGFNCSGNGANLTALDPSHNTQLEILYCSSNQLSSLDVSHNTQLTELYCSSNQLSSLDISHNTQLTMLSCSNNSLNSLDISQNTQLTRLHCYNNSLTSLDVSKNTQLKELYCDDNKFTTAALDDIYCALPDRKGDTNGKIQPVYNSSSSNHATVLATNKQNATSKNWKVQYNNNTDIPTTTGRYVCSGGGGKPNMSRYITLTVQKDSAIRLDFKAAAAGTPVRIVSGSNTQDVTVGTSWLGEAGYTAGSTTMTVYGDLIGFGCGGNGANITALDPSHNTQLKRLYCSSNSLSRLDVSKNTELMSLDCYDNTLSSLDVSKNTQLIGLYCSDNSFSTSALDDIYCALPVRQAPDSALIEPVYNSSSPDIATVLATNAQNAIAKNWKVQYYYDDTDIPTTTGKHKCSATDIAEATAEQALTLYPNPVADVLYLSATARIVRIYDIYGIEVAHATDTDRVEVSHLPAGIYTVRADGTVAKMVKR